MTIDYHDYSLIPEHMMKSLKNYEEKGERVGGFLTAILSNDLFAAVGKADHKNKPLIPVYVHYIYWNMPHTCHGSLDEMIKWYELKDKEREDWKGENEKNHIQY